MGTIAIASGMTAYVDANVLIYAVESIEPFATLLRPVWEAARLDKVRLIGSELLIIETLTGPMKRNHLALVAAYEQVLRASELKLFPVTASILRQGATIRATYGLKTPDAIHAATALEFGCSIYLTNDEGFRRVPGICPVILSDLLRM